VAKKVKKPTRNMKKGEYYKVDGDKLERTKKSCPKCGAGVFMGEHKNRFVCGNCGYTEWKKTDKPVDVPKEVPKEAPKADAPKVVEAKVDVPKAEEAKPKEIPKEELKVEAPKEEKKEEPKVEEKKE
jgi:ubiquitin-small subunit ribosomal protein S27Ae